ncbi:ArsC family reductase [Salinicola sp. JS01]|uniref:ArsC family reductase n=1 Tax=Salinicola sp. JS01 TaxID=3050071 RepID=UPI00255B6A01|nr:ArsC family reductase [Salinicola sp. JS01]WIX32007.1 ArsC family reductase [Salinicola sp. JS01]
MTTTLYGIKTCDTCRKARRQLADQGVEYRYHDLRADGLDADLLDRLLAAADWQTLLNTRSTTWRGLDDHAKQDVDATRARALMLEHPTLLKRPLLAHGETLIVGFDPARYANLGA